MWEGGAKDGVICILLSMISLLSTGHVIGMEQRQDGEEFFLYWGGGAKDGAIAYAC